MRALAWRLLPGEMPLPLFGQFWHLLESEIWVAMMPVAAVAELKIRYLEEVEQMCKAGKPNKLISGSVKVVRMQAEQTLFYPMRLLGVPFGTS